MDPHLDPRSQKKPQKKLTFKIEHVVSLQQLTLPSTLACHSVRKRHRLCLAPRRARLVCVVASTLNGYDGHRLFPGQPFGLAVREIHTGAVNLCKAESGCCYVCGEGRALLSRENVLYETLLNKKVKQLGKRKQSAKQRTYNQAKTNHKKGVGNWEAALPGEGLG
jgi:hypothetical protein